MTTKNKLIIAVALFVLLTAITTCCGIKCNQTNKQLKEAQNTVQTMQDELTTIQDDLQDKSKKLDKIKQELSEANTTISDLKKSEHKLIYLGNFKITHYCTGNYQHICGNGDGVTATGTKVTPGTTIAVDPSRIPYGSKVYIEGYGWRSAQDCGGAVKGNHIDVAVSTHDEAMKLGTSNKGVWILIKNS